MSETDRFVFDGLVHELVDTAVGAIRSEIRAAALRNDDRYELTGGILVGRSMQDQLWSFQIDLDAAVEPETPGVLIIAGLPEVAVRVIAVGDSNIVVVVSEPIDASTVAAELSLDVSEVYGKLVERLSQMVDSASDSELVEQIWIPDQDAVIDIADLRAESSSWDLNADPDSEQQFAAQRAIEPGVRFTWGPPGTGKTTVLARAVRGAVERGDNVLLLSHANAAVDVALARVADDLVAAAARPEAPDLVAEGVVVRVGTPQSPDMMARTELLPEAIAHRRDPTLAVQIEELEHKRRTLSDSLRVASPEEHEALVTSLRETRAAILAARSAVREAAIEVTKHARVIGTTLARAVVDPNVWNFDAQVVVVDEASMAAMPFVLALCLRPATTLSFFGDFRQLPPIAVSEDAEAQRWFGVDVFQTAGILEAHELGLIDDRMTTLRTQFRMGENVCRAVNELSYGGLLRTHHSARRRGIKIAEALPGEGDELIVLDTSGMGTVCTVEAAEGSYSRFNPLSAVLCAAVVDQLVGSGCEDVAVVSPYRSQISLLAPLVERHSGVAAATIHRFQGSERDAVVLDMTDGYDQLGPSALTGKTGHFDIARRLLNVAVSRAKGKLVFVTDVAFLLDRHPPPSPARALFQILNDIGAREMHWSEFVASAAAGDVPQTTRWFPSMSEALEVFAWGDSSHLINWPTDSKAFMQVARELNEIAGPTVFTTPGVARSIEHTTAQISLRPVSTQPWIVADRRGCLLGSSESAGPGVMIDNLQFAHRLLPLLGVDK